MSSQIKFRKVDILGKSYRCIYGLHCHLILLGRYKKRMSEVDRVHYKQQKTRTSSVTRCVTYVRTTAAFLTVYWRQMLQNSTEYDSRHGAAQHNISFLRDAMQHNTKCFLSEGRSQLSPWQFGTRPKLLGLQSTELTSLQHVHDPTSQRLIFPF
jgi:hypothetical protein